MHHVCLSIGFAFIIYFLLAILEEYRLLANLSKVAITSQLCCESEIVREILLQVCMSNRLIYPDQFEVAALERISGNVVFFHFYSHA